MRYPTKYVLVTDLGDTNSVLNSCNNLKSSSISGSSNLASNVIINNCSSNSNSSSSSSKNNNNGNNNLLLVENTPLSHNSHHQNSSSGKNLNNNSSNNGSSNSAATPSGCSNTKALFTAPLSASVPDAPTNDLGNPLSMHIPLRADIVLPDRVWQDCIANDPSKLLAPVTDDNNENASGTANGLNSSGEGSCPNNNNCWEFGDPTQKYSCTCVR